MALSGVDLALWDLRGKRSNKLIVELLGGEPGRTLPTYVTVGLGDDGVEDAVAAGHQAFKLFVAGDASSNRVAAAIERVKEAREIVGPEAPLMIDAWMKWDVETSLAVAEKMVLTTESIQHRCSLMLHCRQRLVPVRFKILPA